MQHDLADDLLDEAKVARADRLVVAYEQQVLHDREQAHLGRRVLDRVVQVLKARLDLCSTCMDTPTIKATKYV